jgi:hypothetical protein
MMLGQEMPIRLHTIIHQVILFYIVQSVTCLGDLPDSRMASTDTGDSFMVMVEFNVFNRPVMTL